MVMMGKRKSLMGCCGAAANDARVEEEIEVEGNVSKDERDVVMEDVGCY